MTKYNFIIVLCPSTLNQEGKFDELANDGSYLGGQVRMRAAADFYKKGNVEKVIVVGGSDDKVNDMKYYLKENGIPEEKIIRVRSKADTHGNMRAIYKLLKQKLEGKVVGVLTNFYHIPRAMRFAHDPQFDWKVSFIPVCAESVIKQGRPTYLRYTPEYLVRIFNEIKGLSDWEKGTYRNQNEPKEKWFGEIHSEDQGFIE